MVWLLTRLGAWTLALPWVPARNGVCLKFVGGHCGLRNLVREYLFGRLEGLNRLLRFFRLWIFLLFFNWLP